MILLSPTTAPAREVPAAGRPPGGAQAELPLSWRGDDFPRTPAPVRAGPGVEEAERIWAGGLLQAILEVLAGDRPARQLARWLTAGLALDVAAQATLGRRPLPRVCSVRVVRPSPQALELTAVLDYGVRHRAAILRLDRRRTGWIGTRLAIL